MRVFAVDWSGARLGEDRHLWVAEVDGDSGRLVGLAPATRRAAVDQLIAAADSGAGGGMVVGLDFSFSLPAWWLSANRISTVDELWADAARLEGWLAGCAAPFWGRPGRPRPGLPLDQEYRRTELAATPRPRSTFQIGGAGAVGTGSLRGFPHLARLRAVGVGIWPWDAWDPCVAPVVAEVWPRLALAGVVKSSPTARARWVALHRGALDDRAAVCIEASDDALDAAAAALHLALDAGRVRPTPTGPTITLEGWIDGVALPDPPGPPGPPAESA